MRQNRPLQITLIQKKLFRPIQIFFRPFRVAEPFDMKRAKLKLRFRKIRQKVDLFFECVPRRDMKPMFQVGDSQQATSMSHRFL